MQRRHVNKMPTRDRRAHWTRYWSKVRLDKHGEHRMDGDKWNTTSITRSKGKRHHTKYETDWSRKEYFMLWYTMLHHVTIRYAMLSHATINYATLHSLNKPLSRCLWRRSPFLVFYYLKFQLFCFLVSIIALLMLRLLGSSLCCLVPVLMTDGPWNMSLASRRT